MTELLRRQGLLALAMFGALFLARTLRAQASSAMGGGMLPVASTRRRAKSAAIVVALGAICGLAGCAEPGDRQDTGPQSVEEGAAEAGATGQDASAIVLSIADGVMADMEDASPYLQLLEGRRVESLGDNSFAHVEAQAEKARALLAELEAVDASQLSHDDGITYAILLSVLENAIETPQHFWHKFNVTPYAAGSVFSSVLPSALATYRIESEADGEGYLGLVRDVARYVNDDLERLRGQEERGILLPKSAIPGARKVYEALRAGIGNLTAVASERLAALTEEQQAALHAGIASAVADAVLPAIEALLDYLGDDYLERAPEAVGLGQYPGGEAAYRFAIRRETTMDLDPEVIHERGLAYMADIQQQMQAIRDELEFEGTAEEFHDLMRQDSRFYAETPEQVEERYMAYIHEIEPRIPDYFSVLPKAPYGVKRLDPAAEPGMTFGFYQPPNAASPRGNYRYNGSKLESRPMVWTGPLIFHELIPGHHFHIALQRETEASTELRNLSSLFYAAFTEGWANYAASLALEMGILNDPYERYGWLLFDAFIANRLVVDTGMNHLGWSRQKAMTYMLANTFASEEETATETLRYSTDMPAQALAYKLGLEKIREIRADQEAKLGDAFDIRTFHAAVLGSGAMPLPVLEQHVARTMSSH